MPSKLLFFQDLIDFDADWNSNHRLLFHVTELTPGSNIDAVSLLQLAIAFGVRNAGHRIYSSVAETARKIDTEYAFESNCLR